MGPLVASEYVIRAPHRALRGVVHAYVAYAERADGPVRRVQPAVSLVPLILSLGPAIAVDGVERRSFVAGMYDGPAVTHFRGDQLGIGIDVSPLGARRLLGVPLGELARRTVPLEDLLGRDAHDLVERLAALPGWEARFELLDAVLARRLRDAPPVRPAVAAAWHRLQETGGRIGIEALAREVGYSRRQLAVRFDEDVGLGPKAIGRIVRFERACALLRGGAGLAETAAAAGYADQPHLNRESMALSGVPPTQALHLPDVQDTRIAVA